MGGEVAFIDVEHALDPTYAEALGVNIDNLLVSQPDSGEQALEIAEALVRSGAIDVLVVDSVAALTTKAEIDGEMGDSHVGQLARLMSQAMREADRGHLQVQVRGDLHQSGAGKIGVMYGNPETTPGGRALKFYASVRMEVRRGEPIKDGSSQIGNRTKVKINKNKVAPPFREAEFDILYGQGISRTGEVIDVAVELGIVKKGGAWFSYQDQKLGQGRENAKKTLEDNPELMKEIEAQILEHKDELMASTKKKRRSPSWKKLRQRLPERTPRHRRTAAKCWKPRASSTRWRTAKIWRSVQRTTSKNLIRRKVTAQHDHYHTGCP